MGWNDHYLIPERSNAPDLTGDYPWIMPDPPGWERQPVGSWQPHDDEASEPREPVLWPPDPDGPRDDLEGP